MKAVVVEISGKYAVVMGKNGTFQKIRNNGRMQVGYEVEVPSAGSFNVPAFTKFAAVAAVFLLITSTGFGAYSYYKPYSYIDVDINPSIELTANMFDRIIKVEALNDDARDLIAMNSFSNKKLEDGVENILKKAVEKGYLSSGTDENAVMLTVSSKDEKKAEKIGAIVNNKAAERLKSQKVNTEILLEKIPLERREAAREQGLSPGKLMLIEKAQQSNPELKAADLKNAPVKDILKSIRGDRKILPEKKDENKDKKETDNRNNGKNTKNTFSPLPTKSPQNRPPIPAPNPKLNLKSPGKDVIGDTDWNGESEEDRDDKKDNVKNTGKANRPDNARDNDAKQKSSYPIIITPSITPRPTNRFTPRTEPRDNRDKGRENDSHTDNAREGGKDDRNNPKAPVQNSNTRQNKQENTLNGMKQQDYDTNDKQKTNKDKND